MKNKENKTRPFLLTRSFSHAFGGSRHNANPYVAAPQAQAYFHGLPPGPPTWAYQPCAHNGHQPCPDSVRPNYYTPSIRSTTATTSESQNASSLFSHGSRSASTGTSSTHYSGFNSAVYGSQQMYSSVESPPQIHNLLDTASASLVWDVRARPKELPLSGLTTQIISPHVLSFPLVANAPGHIRIISPDIPWSIEIGPKQHAIACSEALHALYDMLSADLEDAIWSLADERKRSSIVRAWKRRPDSGHRIRRVDWLGRHFMFKGFYRDTGFRQQVLRPDSTGVPETLVVAFRKA